MKKQTVIRAAVVGLGGVIMAVALLWLVYRPWALTWGATADEVARAMPGDEFVADATFSATRAVTIEAPPRQIWPWLVQIGYRRAGFYSYDRLDNDGIPSAERILPEYQDLKTGDPVPMAPGAVARVTVLDPPRTLVLLFEVEGVWQGATWAWGLYPVGPKQTRLVTRLRVHSEALVPNLFLDLGEIVMMRKCMLGIKRRAEMSGGNG